MKIRGALALTLAWGLVLTGCASSGGTGAATTTTTTTGGAANLLAQGARPRNTDNTRAAEDALEAAEEAASPDEARVQYQQAVTSAQAAIAEDPTNPLAHLLAGHAYMGVEDYATASQHFDHAIERRPLYEIELSPVREQRYIELYQEAAPLLQQGAYLEAAEVLEDANAIYPARPEALITLAQIYTQERQHDRAIERIDQAIVFFQGDRVSEVDSATAAAWREESEGLPMMRAQVLVDAGRYEEAVGTYRQMSAADPSNISITQDLAAILMTMGDTAQARPVYEALLTRPGLGALDYYRVGVGFYQMSDYTRAAQAFGEGVERSPMDRDGIEMWARSLQLDSAFAQVPPVAERWVALDPASQIALTVHAQAVNLGGNAQQAAEIMRAVTALYATVDNLELRRTGGSVSVSGSVGNKTLEQGARVTLTFTFYSESGAQIGTATEQVAVGAQGSNQVFTVEFESTETVGGYGYTIARG